MTFLFSSMLQHSFLVLQITCRALAQTAAYPCTAAHPSTTPLPRHKWAGCGAAFFLGKSHLNNVFTNPPTYCHKL